MTTSAPLRRPSTQLCPGCGHQRPLGHFSTQLSLDHDPKRWRRVEHTHCRACRAGGRGAPGRPMQ